jgi:hypothetical protein
MFLGFYSLSSKPPLIMNKLILSLLIGFSAFQTTFAQTFFVEPSEKGFESKIIDKMKYNGYKLSDTKEGSDFTIQCFLDGHYNYWKFGPMFRGYVKISDSKTGDEVSRTKEVGKSPNIYNGMQAGPKIMSVIADKYLIPELNKLPKQ